MSKEKFYTFCASYAGKVYIRGVRDGKKFIAKNDFKPSLWLRTNQESEFKSLSGAPLQQLEFDSPKEYREHLKSYKDVTNYDLYGDIAVQYQYLYENYTGVVDYDYRKLNITVLDIETTVEHGFPEYSNPLEEVLLITLADINTGEYVTFGTKKVHKLEKKTKYVYCSDEQELFEKFVSYWASNYPDIATGWNVDEFDFPYLYERMKRVSGETLAKKLSPFGMVHTREINVQGITKTLYDIIGVAILDYLPIYKKFGFRSQENYRLDTVAESELKENKLENPHSTFKEHYTLAWDSFVDYNIHDVALIERLEAKKNLIRLVVSVAYIAKINYRDVFSPVKTWDVMIYNYLRDQNIIVPLQRFGDDSEGIEGAYVKAPEPAMYDWVVSFDLNSLYPHIIMALNMSPETIDNTLAPTGVHKLLGGDYAGVKEGYSLAANGSRYDMGKSGFLPDLMRKLYDTRKSEKKLMLKAESALEEERSTATPERIDELETIINTKNSLQNSLKTLLNSGYGASANVAFRFFDQRIAEGITMTGQLVIQNSERNANEYLKKITGVDKDYVIASDTDSLYVSMNELVNKFVPNKTTEEKVTFLEQACESKIAPTLNAGSDLLAEQLNWNKDLLVFKLEVVADRGVFVAKKRYALHVYSSEGVRYEEPELKIKGLEIVRTGTAKWIRDRLRDAVNIIMTGSESELHSFVAETEEKFHHMPADMIAFNSSANNLAKYSSKTTIYGEKCPIAVRATLLYNHHIADRKLELKYQTIKEGEKVKFVNLVEPNHFREDVIAFQDKLPPEFSLDNKLDYNFMFEKSFIKPLDRILNTFGWTSKEVATLEGLFG